MNIQQSTGTIRITDISQEEIYALLKCKIKIKMIANNPFDSKKPFGFIYLLDRNDNGTIIVSHAKRAIKKDESIKLSKVIDLINELYLFAVNKIIEITGINEVDSFGFNDIIEIVIEKEEYFVKQELIEIIPKIANKIDNIISIDYEQNMFIVNYKDGNNDNFVSSIYYWPTTKDIYIFESTEPIFSYNRPDRELQLESIEDVIDLF